MRKLYFKLNFVSFILYFVSYCILWYYIVLCLIVLYCIIFYQTVLYCIVLLNIMSYRIIPYCTVLYCIVLYILYCIKMDNIVLYNNISYCIVLCHVILCFHFNYAVNTPHPLHHNGNFTPLWVQKYIWNSFSVVKVPFLLFRVVIFTAK